MPLSRKSTISIPLKIAIHPFLITLPYILYLPYMFYFSPNTSTEHTIKFTDIFHLSFTVSHPQFNINSINRLLSALFPDLLGYICWVNEGVPNNFYRHLLSFKPYILINTLCSNHVSCTINQDSANYNSGTNLACCLIL